MAIDELTYPLPIANRQGPSGFIAPVSGPAPAPPRTRIVNFYIEVGANQRSTRSYGPFRGPAIVQRCVAVADPVAANDNAFFFPGYSQVRIEEALVNVQNGVSWPTWFERMPQQGADFDRATRGIVNAVGLSQKTNWDMPIDGVVNLGEWFLTMSVGQVGGAAGFAWSGYVIVLEGVSPAALANFL